MSTLVSDLIAEAATRISDPSVRKIVDPEWLGYYNDACHTMSRDYKVIEQDATFDTVVNEDRYDYPDDMVQMVRLRYSATPSDDTTYKDLGEKFSDEARELEQGGKTSGDPTRYWARGSFVQLIPRPGTAVADGGLISYWRTADRVTVVAGSVLEFRDVLRLFVRDRMVIFGKERLERYDEANRDLQVWTAAVEKVLDKIEDPSIDRQSRVRVPPARRAFSRMS